MEYAIEVPNKTDLLANPVAADQLPALIAQAKKLSRKKDEETGFPQTIYLLAFKDGPPVGQLVFSGGECVDADGEFYAA